MNYCQINENTLEQVYYVPVFATPSSVIPSNIKVIGKNAFAGLSSFSEIVIPPSVEIIGSGAFHNCKGLKKITIPATVQKVEDGAFANCTALEEVIYSSNTRFSELCFSGCCALKQISDGVMVARTFYFPKHNQFAITIKQEQLSTKEYTIYKGRFADNFFPDSEPNLNAPVIYFAEIIKKGQIYVWYDTDVKMAIKGARYQASGKSAVDFFKKEWTISSTMTPNEFSLLTGICFEGVNIWLKVGECDRNAEWPLNTVLAWLQKELPVIHKRLVFALEHQHEPSPIKFFEDGIVRNQLL